MQPLAAMSHRQQGMERLAWRTVADPSTSRLHMATPVTLM